MQRVGYLFDDLLQYENLLIAFKKARKGTKTGESLKFEYNLERELLKLKKEILENKYEPKSYKYFTIKDLKKREVSVAAFRDRVVHHLVVAKLEPIFERIFIFDSYANRKGKGLIKAIKRAQSFIKSNNEYYLKADIKKFFDNIDYEILIGLIEKKIKDKRLMMLINTIIKNDIKKNKGLPIGNLTSQFFANIYLNELDHYVKEKLKLKFYLRYMDDFIIINEDIEKIKTSKLLIEDFCKSKLKLKLKKEATFINKVDNGIPFCGVRIFKKIIRIKRESLNLSIIKIRNKIIKYENNEISEEEISKSLNSIFSYWSKFDTLNLRKTIIKKLNI